MRYIDQNLQLMSEVFREWRLQWQLWHRQKLQMERGYLTEDILMPRYLGHILTEIERLHYGTLSTDWYYRHVQIAPVLFSESSMVYRASIPMLSMDRFLVYGLRYYPVPMKNGYSRKVLGKDTVAIESSDGSWFYPESSVCVGGQPMVFFSFSASVDSRRHIPLFASPIFTKQNSFNTYFVRYRCPELSNS